MAGEFRKFNFQQNGLPAVQKRKLYYDTIDVSEGIDVDKRSESKQCNICHYWYFLEKGFKFQSYVYNRCYDFVMISLNHSDTVISNIKGEDYFNV